MKLIVTLAKGGQDKYEHLRDYKTQDGELDVIDHAGVVVATYAAGAWSSINRVKPENEMWPDHLLPIEEDSSETDPQQFVLENLGSPYESVKQND